MAPSPVTLHAVPKLSMAIYSAIISAQSASVKPSIDVRSPSEAIIQPPGIPGAAMMVTPSMQMKPANIPKSKGIPRVIIRATAQETILSVEPDMWMVAQSGTVNPATAGSTPSFSA